MQRAVDHVDHSRATDGTAQVTFAYSGMSRFPNQPPKPKLTPQERRVRADERLTIIRLRMAIWQELDARGITTPDAIGAALRMPAGEAVKLLTWWRRRSYVAALEAVVAQLGAQVPAPWRPRRYEGD